MIQVQVLNKEEVKKFLEDKNKEINEKVQQSIYKSAEFLRTEVKESIAGRRNEPTSVDTGRFLNSIDIEVSEDNALVFTDVDYAQYLEYGTSRINPRKHFENSADRNHEKVKQIFEEDIKSL
jgi:HK97 gp10 family phage protein